MVTAKNLIKNYKADLGWDTQDADYTSWRNAVKDYCAQNNIRSWSGASEGERQALIAAAPGLTRFRPSIRARIASGSEFYRKAIEALLQDCMKKKSETAKNLVVKRALKRARTDDRGGDGDGEGSDEIEDQGAPVAIWLTDPAVAGHRDANNNGIWNERA